MNTVLLNLSFLLLTSFFSLQFQDIDGNAVNMSSFQGKKILIVNIATGSDSIKVAQLGGLQQLKQRFGDSLVIIGFPSNSFGKEPRSNAEIKQFCHGSFNTSFLIASKVDVVGQNAHPVFTWLASKIENGAVNAPVNADYQKFLIDEQGHLVGMLSSKVKPMDSLMIKTIKANN